MKRLLRIGAIVGAVLVVAIGGGALWFFATIPAPPSPPPDLGAQDRDTSSVPLPAVRSELLRMHWVDQAVRAQVVKTIRTGGTQGLGTAVHLLQLAYLEGRVDERNTARLKALVDAHGWLHAGRVGENGAEAAFTIAQHADHDPQFQERVLNRLREAYENGHATGQQVALLTDRVRVNQGKPQVYGTQAQLQNGTVTFVPIRDSSGVNQRRAKMGLPPLSEYAEQLKAKFRTEIPE